MGSKWAHFTCSGTTIAPESFLEKYAFDAFWTHFGSQNSPFSRHFLLAFWEKRYHFRPPKIHHGLFSKVAEEAKVAGLLGGNYWEVL